MKIKTQQAVDVLGFKKPHELAVFLNYTRQAGYRWNEYLPELATRRLLEKCPGLERLIEDEAA